MATRDNQTLQIVVLVFVFLAVIGIGASIWFYSDAQAAHQQVAELQAAETDRRQNYNQLQQEVEQFKQMLGFQPEDNLQTIREDFQKDMGDYGATFAEENRNYRTIVENVAAENQQLAVREQELRKEHEALNQKFLALQNEKDQAIAEFRQKSEAAEQHGAQERQKFTQARAELQKQMEQLVSSLSTKDEQYKAELAKLQEEIDRITKEGEDKAQQIAQLQAGRQQDHTVFERADGRVTWVNQSSGMVWINLGYADALREQITFSIYERSSPVAGENEPKARIEVTRIAGDHLSEARITSDEALNPIVPGDLIYSPVWEKGKQVRFALTGQIDIDGDGTDDSERVRRIITANGGVVDAYVNEQGEQVGEMTVNTRFLIVGTRPEQGRDANLLKAQQASMQEMLRQASTKDVDEISIDKFLSFVGWQPGERTVTLGSGASGAGIPRQSNGGNRGTSTGATSDSADAGSFRRRSPATPY